MCLSREIHEVAAAHLLHAALRMGCFSATEESLNQTKHSKVGVYESGRLISKPPPSATRPPSLFYITTLSQSLKRAVVATMPEANHCLKHCNAGWEHCSPSSVNGCDLPLPL